jgi:hypothetical protein
MNADMTNLLNKSLASYGFNYYNNTTPKTGSWHTIQIITDSVITTVGENSNLTSLTLTAGTYIYGKFTGITLASGSILAYRNGG